LSGWVTNKIIVVKKNQYHWDAQKVHLNEIHFPLLIVIMMRTEHFVPVSFTLPIMFLWRRLNTIARMNQKFFFLDLYLPLIFTDLIQLENLLMIVKVRKALCLAIDRDWINASRSIDALTLTLTLIYGDVYAYLKSTCVKGWFFHGFDQRNYKHIYLEK